MRLAISWMIHQSCRASPGSGSAGRPICTWRLVLVTVPSFSGQAEAGRIDVGIDGGLGEEEVLHHEMLEVRERLARVVEIGVRHRRVFALDVHALDLVGVDRVHDLDDGQALLRIELDAPALSTLPRISGSSTDL